MADVGVLLVQLGTPDAPTPAAVKRYLAEFLSDPRVVDLPRAFWLPLLHGVILPRRAPRSAALYQKIWRADGLSPLLHISQQQAAGVAARLGAELPVALAMRYGEPAIAPAVASLLAQGVSRLLVFPLYPQASGSTTGAALDGVAAALRHHRFVPALRLAAPFHDHPDYLAAVARRVRAVAPAGAHYLVSFHGLPVRHIQEGDPYADHCAATASGLARLLEMPPERWHVAFQSRFGREPWLTPATSDTLANLPRQGVKKLVVLCPGFVADCLETLEEIAHTGRESFLAAGGESFTYAPCVNDDPLWLDALAGLVARELKGWSWGNPPL